MTKKNPFPHIYGESLALLTDLYEITMAYGYWKAGMQNYEAVFHHCFRKAPFRAGFTLTAGLEALINYLERFRFEDSDLEYLETLEGNDGKKLFDLKFLDYLGEMRFSCDVDAVPEGTPIFPYEPMLKIQGPLIQCQLLETAILTITNFPTLIATKAARVRTAAEEDSVIEFGLRRAQGIDGGVTASRAAYIGGCDATSNVLAGKIFGIPVKGTHAHSWIMVFDDEKESFQTYAEQLPSNCIFLVDTYDTIKGVKKAIEVGYWLRENGHEMAGVRLDSGDLAYLSIEARKMLDEAGFPDAVVVASNELDETLIGDLKRQGAKITVWGVGTNLVTAKDQPALDGVYKLSAVREEGGAWKHRLKLSEQMIKISNPGIPQVKRFVENGQYIGDAIYDLLGEPESGWTIVDPLDATRRKQFQNESEAFDLLVPIFRGGKRVYELPEIQEIQAYARRELKKFHGGIKRFLNPHQYPVGLEQSLYKHKIELVQALRHKNPKHTEAI